MNKRPSKLPSLASGSSFFDLSPKATTKISLYSLVYTPFKTLIQNWQNFFMLGIPTALLLSFFSMLLKQPALCNLNSEMSLTSSFCQSDIAHYYTDLLIHIFILLIYATKWYKFSIIKAPFTCKNLFLPNVKDMKATGLICLFLIFNICPLIALALLIFRVPNPDWKIELLYFTSVAWLFLLPLLTIRIYALLALAFEQDKLPSLKDFLKQTSGNMLKLLLSSAIIVFLALFIFMNYYAFVGQMKDFETLSVVTAEFEYNVLVTFFATLCLNYSKVQKDELFKGGKNEH